MFQLIATIMAIALTSALVLVSINYLPFGQEQIRQTDHMVRRMLPQLETAYDIAMRATDGVAPVVTGGPDGGLAANFKGILAWTPVAPEGFQWTYGKRPDDGGLNSGREYFCLNPISTTKETVGRGLYLGSTAYSREQLVISTSCGATAWGTKPSSWTASTRVALTFYVAYTPGLSR